MIEIHPVQSLDLPELAPYRSLKWQDEHRKQGVFVAEGENVVRRLLESDLEVISLLLPEKWVSVYEPLLMARQEAIPVYTAKISLLEKLVGFSLYQGVHALARVPAPVPINQMLIGRTPFLGVILDGISSADNLGGIVRNCAAFGADGLILTPTSCSPYLRRSVRCSMGTIFKLSVAETSSLVDLIKDLRSRNIRCLAAHPHSTERSLFEADLTGDLCIVLGSEGHGISPEVLAACDEAVAIPMKNKIDSLNVGTAAAVFLYEVNRTRRV